MAQKKYQVFVSSTFRDLVDERQDAIRNILDLKHIPAGMELFPAADIDQFDYIKKIIDECDYYILIMGGRYGSIDANGVSYTEREYDYAVDTGKIVVAFVHSEPESLPVSKSDVENDILESLDAFRKKVMTGRLVKSWRSRQELEPLLLKSLIHAFNDFPQVGWIRGDSAASEIVLEQSNKALRENAILHEKIKVLEQQITTPKLENIADFDDKFRVRCRSRHLYGGRYSYKDHEMVVTWRQLFVAIAGFLEKSKTDEVILRGLKELAKEIVAGFAPHDMNETDKITIKIQLEALGLIKTQVSNTIQGGVAEFLSLTPAGRQAFIQARVVRKS
jgi:hypothetical protein